MKKIRSEFILILLLFGSLNDLFSQNNVRECECYYDTVREKEIYTLVETFPNYPYGIDKFYDKFYLKVNYDKLKMVPEKAIFQDRVLVCLIIDNDGTLIHFSVKNKDKKDYHLVDQEVMRVLELMDEKWIPGKCKDEKVATQMDLLFKFQIVRN